jgi:TolB-like protein/Flp pilus assembly protein TadD/tRNA A-37 threonylcarbamoyl transferase component Bud32
VEVQERLSEALSGTYRIEGEIGSGGMATVYRAEDLKHDRQVALKVLRPELAMELGADRFVREIEIAAKLVHPHILPLFDSGQADGFLYYVMPYVEGESLEYRIAREGKLPAEEAIRLTDQIASALTYAHEQGVVHRDIKPGNILLAGDQAIVADFGIARVLEAASTEGLTFTGLAVGTPAYMSPEQAMGGEEVDARSDVYSLGCVVYEMMTGGAPFEGTDPAAAAAKRKVGRGPSLRTTDPSIPASLDRAVSKALATDPGERFDTAAAFAEALTTGTVVAPVRARRARPWVAIVGAAAMVLAALAGWWLVQGGGGPRMERLAVLPLTNLTQDPEQQYLADGVHEALIAELGQLGIHMIARQTMARYRDTEKGVHEIAAELGVDGVIEGSVFREGDSLEIATQLLDREEREVWVGSFEGVLPNIVALYRGFARAIADQIHLTLEPRNEARLTEAASVNPAVYEDYLRGMQILTNRTSREDANRAIEYFNHAVEQNPADALAWAGLAYCYVTLGHGHDPPDDAWQLTEAAAQLAIRYDPLSAEGWSALADYRSYYARDWAGAEEAFRRANELNPNLPMNHYHYSWYLVLFGRIEEALAEHRRAQEIDPLTPMHTYWIPALHWFSGDNDRALREVRPLLEQYPNNSTVRYVVAESAARLGLFDEAIPAIEEAASMAPAWRPYLAKYYAWAGRTEDALRILNEYEAQGPTAWNALPIALTHAILGNLEEAIHWLEHEPRHGWVAWQITSQSKEFQRYRDDPRYQAFLRKINLRYGPEDEFPVALPVASDTGI